MADPTRRQVLLLQAIYYLSKEANGRPPSFPEITDRLRLPRKASGQLSRALLPLEKAGWLVRDHGSNRSMYLTEEGEYVCGVKQRPKPPEEPIEFGEPDWKGLE